MAKIPDIPTHQDHVDGYRDGYDLTAPEPSANRSERYKHSFRVGRAERTKTYMPLNQIIESLETAEIKDTLA